MNDDVKLDATSMPFPPGTILAGKYRVDRLLGEGGMGWVVVATHLQLEQRVALKFMRTSHLSASAEAVGRFLREARAAARIQSEHVARVSDVGTLENGAPYLVMEYLEGRDLDSLLQATPSLPIGEAIEYAMQACEGLGEVHTAGIVHRDLKPANLFLARRSDGSARVKLLDFGISKVSALGGGVGGADGAMTSTQALMGSPLYMAPEQMRSSKTVDARADIWSMGVILYEMLCGRSPFGGDTLPEVCARIMAEPPASLRAVRPDVPLALEAVVMRCLEKDPQRRFQDVAALAQALAPFGPYEARTAADRIGRVMRKTQPSSADAFAGPATADAPSAARRHETAQTAATFGTAAPSPIDRRGRPLPRAALGAVIAVVALAAIVLVATLVASPASHGSPAETRGAASMGSRPEVSVTSGDIPPPLPSLEPASAVQPTVNAAGASPLASTSLSGRGPAPARGLPKPKPGAAPSAGPSAKPAATSGFGGRD